MEPLRSYLKTRSGIFITVLVTVLLSVFLVRDNISQLYKTYFGNSTDLLTSIQEFPREIQKSVQKGAENSTPVEAKKEQESPKSFLTVDGVVKYTNQERAAKGLRTLTVNAKLNGSAFAKAQDMFKLQYFEHVSPGGKDAGDLVSEAGYQYILVGENLALGNFENDKVLVQAWMDSPGHRANILNSGYTEIGVSVLKGMYNGRSTWMAVQHFGKPLSSCPQLNQNIKNQIETNNSRLSQMEGQLQTQKADIENTPKDDPSYNQKVDSYNAAVEEYNNLLAETKGLIADYNGQIEAFNKCAG